MRISTSCPRLMLGYFLAFAGIASAATIHFTFKGATAEVSFNGGPPTRVDLSVDLLANTADLVKGGGWWGSDRYVNLKGFISSNSLGLSNVEAVTPLEVHIGGPAAELPFRNSSVMLSTGNNVLSGFFNLKAIEAWDRVSSIGPLSGSASTSVPPKLVLKNGSTLAIRVFDSVPPYGNASFQAHIIPSSVSETSAQPVDGSLRKLSEKDLYLQTGGNKVVRFRLLAKTLFRDQQGAQIRDSLLHPGDQLSVIVNPDDSETAVAVVLVRKRE